MLLTSTYPMWYNIIPPFVPLDPSLYPIYPIGTKGFDLFVFRNYINYEHGNVYLIPKQPIVPPTYTPHYVGNQSLIMVQPITSRGRQLNQQLITTPIPSIVLVNTNLPTYIPKGSPHRPPDGGQLGDSFRGSSFEKHPLGGPPFNPHVGFYGWPTLDPCMFIPPRYPQPIIQLVPKPITKLPYRKLQYPTYVKDTNLDVHIKVFKKAIKANGETMEVNIINLLGFTLQNNIIEWGENFIQNHPNYTFKELEQAFCKGFRIVKNNEEVYM
jgi:hypothetical protein